MKHFLVRFTGYAILWAFGLKFWKTILEIVSWNHDQRKNVKPLLRSIPCQLFDRIEHVSKTKKLRCQAPESSVKALRVLWFLLLCTIYSCQHQDCLWSCKSGGLGVLNVQNDWQPSSLAWMPVFFYFDIPVGLVGQGTGDMWIATVLVLNVERSSLRPKLFQK